MAAAHPPIGARAVLDDLAAGRSPGPVIVSFTGDRMPQFDCHHVFPAQGRRHDWGFMRGLQAFLLVAPGVDAEDAIGAIVRVCSHSPYPTVVDMARKRVAYVVGPATKLWHMRADSAEARQWFEEMAA